EWTGWAHHHWLCDVDQERSAITFTFKHHIVHAPRFRLPAGTAPAALTAETVLQLWWDGELNASERIHMDPATLDAELDAFRATHAPPRRGLARRWRSA
ncbi:MAG: hypothetical protein JW895_08305, partial [Thermoleophilaceae bacterium]|nr:hypothetical protein [Thermoleophilaceae bacterium]